MKSRHRSPRNALVIIAASEQKRFLDDALSWALTFRLDRDAFSPRPVNTWRCLTWLLGAGPSCPL